MAGVNRSAPVSVCVVVGGGSFPLQELLPEGVGFFTSQIDANEKATDGHTS